MSKKLTRSNRDVRYLEIEEQGCYTKRGIDAVVEGRGTNWAGTVEGATTVATTAGGLAASASDPFANVALKESSGSTVETEASKDNPYGHIRGARALGNVNGRIPSTKPERNKSVGAIGKILSPSSPKGHNVTF